MEDQRIRYHYTLTVNRDGFRGQQHTVDAYTVPDAIRKLVFRLFPGKAVFDSLDLADSIYDNQDYKVVGQVPAYEDKFRTEKDPNWKNKGGPSLRDIAKDMEDMSNIKDTLYEDFPENPDEDTNG